MIGGPKVAMTIAGLVLLAVFVGAGLGFIPGGSLTAAAPSGCPLNTPSCNPIFIANAPYVTVSGLNASITVTGIAVPANVVNLRSVTLSISGTNTPIPPVPLTWSGPFVIRPFIYTAPSTGTYTVFATLIAGVFAGPSVPGGITSVSPVTTFIVKSTTGPGTNQTCGTACPTASAAFKVTSSGLGVTMTDSSTVSGGNTTVVLGSSLVIAWGDGTTTPGAVGATLTHTYMTAGVETVVDKVTATVGSYTSSSSQSLTITVAAGTTPTSNTTAISTPSGTHFTSLIGAGIFGAIAIILIGAFGLFRWWAAILAVGLLVVGYVTGPFL